MPVNPKNHLPWWTLGLPRRLTALNAGLQTGFRRPIDAGILATAGPPAPATQCLGERFGFAPLPPLFLP